METLDLYLEAERRGLLPEKEKALLNEARKRGIVKDQTTSEQSPVFEAFAKPSVPDNKPKEDPRIAALRATGAHSPLRGVPGLGGALDEIAAGGEAALNFVTGGRFGDPYDVALQKQREAQKRSDEEYPIRNTLENIAGGLTLTPFRYVKVFSRGNQANTLNTAADAGLNAGVLGAAEGFTSGEGGFKNRVENAKNYGELSAALGMVLGAGAQQIANRYKPTPLNALSRDAKDIGVNIPKFMEGTQSTSNIAAKLGGIPFVGDDINNAVAATRQQTAQAAKNIANKASGGGTTPQAAGEAAKASLQQYSDETITQIQNRLFEPVRTTMGNANIPLSSTQRVARQLQQEQTAAASPIHQRALNEITEAVDRGSLNYSGMSALRTRIGNLISNKIDPENRPARAALERVYAGLSQDLENGVRAYGGPTAQRAWERANKLSRELASRREAITKVIGTEGKMPGEGVIDKVWRLSSSGSNADAATINRLRRAMGNDAWQEMSGSIIERLGRNQSDQFSPDIFLKNYSALSESGRNSLFNNELRGELNKLANVSGKLQQFGKLGNTSNTGGVVALLMSLASSTYSLTAAGSVAGMSLAGRSIGRLMARPAIIREANRYVNAMSSSGGRPSRTVPLAAASLANAISEETGEDPKEIQQKLLALNK